MELVGIHPVLGNVVVKESQELKSAGRVTQIGKDGATDTRDFPAQSFFDVFVEVTVQGQTLHNSEPVRMQNTAIRALPPIGSQYQPPTPKRIQLLDQTGAVAPFCLVHARHVPEDPSHIILFRELLMLEAKLDYICANHGPALAPGCGF